jgi:chromosome segregation ATPase
MSGLDQLLRLQKWNLDEKRRQAADLEGLIQRLQGDVARLDAEVAREVEAARNDLQAARVLPPYRAVMASRRERLEQSIADVTIELDRVREEIAETFADIKKTEQAIQLRQERRRQELARREQIVADEMGLEQYRRNRGKPDS